MGVTIEDAIADRDDAVAGREDAGIGRDDAVTGLEVALSPFFKRLISSLSLAMSSFIFSAAKFTGMLSNVRILCVFLQAAQVIWQLEY